MLDITAANTAALPTTAKPAPAKGYRLRADAEAAAVHDIGPHARRGFEYETWRCDGKWHWKPTDEVKPPTAADIKANGGKRYVAHIVPQPKEKPVEVKPEDLDIPPFLQRKGKPMTSRKIQVYECDTASLPKSETLEAMVRPSKEAAVAALAPEKPAGKPKRKAKGNSPKKGKRTSKAPAKAAGVSIGTRPDGLMKGSAMATLVDTICRKDGATNEELCKAVGWKQCLPCLRKACAKAGVTIRVEKAQGELARYFGTPT